MTKLRNRMARMRHPEHFRMEQIAIKTPCGAAGCFVYHALDLNGNKPRLLPKLERTYGLGCGSGRCEYKFDGVDNDQEYEAAKAALGLTHDEADTLFNAYHLKTPKEAVAFIDKMIANAE